MFAILRNTYFLTHRCKIGGEPLLRQKQFIVDDRPGGPRSLLPVGIAQDHRYLALIYLAHTAIVLAQRTRTFNPRFLVGALVQDQQAAFGQFRPLANIRLDLPVDPSADQGELGMKCCSACPSCPFICRAIPVK
jgi:hypothetical protein